jgi:hypothetical protein
VLQWNVLPLGQVLQWEELLYPRPDVLQWDLLCLRPDVRQWKVLPLRPGLLWEVLSLRPDVLQ